MKRITNKILIRLILVIILFEACFSNSLISYAAEDKVGLSPESIEKILSLGTGIVSVILWIPKYIVTSIINLFYGLMGGIAEMENTTSPGSITPYKIFFGKYDLLNVNMFDNVGKPKGFGLVFRESIATWYYTVRLIAVVILLVILIYVGIRMALSSVADDKAKYKKMLFDWVVGLALIFVIHYIALFTVYCNDAIVHAIDSAYSQPTDPDNPVDTAEDMIYEIQNKAAKGVGMISFFALLVYVGIVAQTIFFLLAYINRVLKVGFLLVISPLITVTYAIDKMGDGKAQALESWLKEYVYTILIQPFHCIIYFSFISIAFELVVPKSGFTGSYNQLAAGVLAMFCIKFVNDAEKIVRKIFGFQDDNSKTSMAAGAMMGVALVKNAGKMASGAKRGVNALGNAGTKLNKMKNNFVKDAPKIQAIMGNKGPAKYLGKGIGKLGSGVDKISKGIDSAKGKVKNSRVGKAATAANKKINGVKSAYGKFKNTKKGRIADAVGRKAAATTAAAIAFAATYATGDTDALSAVGYASAIGSATDKMFDNSHKRNKNNTVLDADEADKLEYEDLEEKKSEAEKDYEDEKTDYENAKEDIETLKEADDYDEQAEDLEKSVKKDESKLKGMEKGTPEYSTLKTSIEEKKDQINKLHEKSDKIKDGLKNDKVREQAKKGLNSSQIDKGYKDRISEKEHKTRALSRTLREFYSEKATRQRFKERRNSVTEQTIKDQSKQIEKLIQQLISKRDQMAGAGNQNGENNSVMSHEDMMDGKRIASLLQANIQKDYFEHSGLSADELLRKAGGEFLSTDYGKGTADKNLAEEMNDIASQLRTLVREQQINYRVQGIDKAAELDKAMGRDSDRFEPDVMGEILANASHNEEEIKKANENKTNKGE